MNISITDDMKVSYINKKTNEIWTNWKYWKDCSEEDKNKVNLRQLRKDEIVLDIEDKNYKPVIEELKKDGYERYYIINTGSRGFHIHLFFNNLSGLNKEQRNEVRKIFIKKYKCDVSKSSEDTLISIEGRPHFKTNVKAQLLDESIKGGNVLNNEYIQQALLNIERYKKINEQVNKDKDFINYFEQDPLFQHIKNNIIPDGTNRDMTIFPNLAIASVRTGKTKEEIEKIIKPIIQKNFPGKSYAEFNGWLQKAFKNKIDTYNQVQLNNWSKEVLKKDFYDLSIESIEELEDIQELDFNNKNRKVFLNDEELQKIKNVKTEWIIQDWIPKGDICFIAGKASSFKTTLCLHMAYSISQGQLVFNKYKTKKSKILFVNEENSNNVFLGFVDRVKKGLDMNNHCSNIYFAMLENFRLDKTKELEKLIEFINLQDIEILICDSFRRFIGFDENSATEMNKLFNNLKILRKRCNNLTIIILHHLKKDNINNPGDLRDMLRGSSDIVNSADSVIGIKRRHGQDAITIEHIKNRAGIELIGKLIIIEKGNNKDKAYFYESDREIDKFKISSAPEKCAEELGKYLEENDIKEFGRKDAEEWLNDHGYNTITRALKILESEGTLTSIGSTKTRKYIFNDVIKSEEIITDKKQQTLSN